MPFKVSSPLFLSSGANCLLPDSRRCMQMLARQSHQPSILLKMQSHHVFGSFCSNGSCRNHLLPQVVLVIRNAAIPRFDGLVLTDQDLLRNLVKQSRGVMWSVFCLTLEIMGAWDLAYLKSWLTTTTPPLKALMASAKLSIVGISKPLVGSSNSSMLGLSMASRANTIRLF